jgi:hypothetical protein
MWALTITSESGVVVASKRTDVPASHEHPGSEHLLELGFGAFPGGYWREEPAGWTQPVMPVARQQGGALAEHDPGQRGS